MKNATATSHGRILLLAVPGGDGGEALMGELMRSWGDAERTPACLLG